MLPEITVAEKVVRHDEVKNALEKAKENGSSKNFDVSPVNMLKGMMSPKQLELFNQYNDMLNN